MRDGPPVLALASAEESVRYVTIDDEPAYRRDSQLAAVHPHLVQVGDYGTVDAFLAVQNEPCHVLVLDLCLNRRTGDAAILQGVQAVKLLTERYGHRVLVHTADERPEPVARCVAAGAVGYVSKFAPQLLGEAIEEVGRRGQVVSPLLDEALRSLARRTLDIRLSAPLEETLVLLGRGLADAEVAALRNLSPRTIEDHKRKILELFGVHMESKRLGFVGLAGELGVGPGDLVNDSPGGRPSRGQIGRNMPWARRRRSPEGD